MVSYKKVHQADDENVLFEAPSHSPVNIELDDINLDSSGPRDQLLSSFDRDSDDLDDAYTNGSKNSDDRLTSNQEDDELTRSIQNNFSVGSSSNIDESSSQNQTHTDSVFSSRSPITMNSIRNQFNFLDRVFRRKPRAGEVVGEGSENDGVFNNLTAKPDLNPTVDSDKPPTYEEAAADQTPPYWENSVLAPGFGEEIFVDGLPVGNIVNFAWNLLVSASFQFVGFLLTYILHTSHAAKHGSRAGLGVTFITYGYNMIPSSMSTDVDDAKISGSKIEPTDANDYNVATDNKIEGTLDSFQSSLSAGSDPVIEESQSALVTWLAYGVIGFGIFLIIKAFINYHRAKKMEQIILQPPAATVITPEQQV